MQQHYSKQFNTRAVYASASGLIFCPKKVFIIHTKGWFERIKERSNLDHEKNPLKKFLIARKLIF